MLNLPLLRIQHTFAVLCLRYLAFKTLVSHGSNFPCHSPVYTRQPPIGSHCFSCKTHLTLPLIGLCWRYDCKLTAWVTHKSCIFQNSGRVCFFFPCCWYRGSWIVLVPSKHTNLYFPTRKRCMEAFMATSWKTNGRRPVSGRVGQVMQENQWDPW